MSDIEHKSYRAEGDGGSRWVKIMTLSNCLNEVVCYVRWPGHITTLLQYRIIGKLISINILWELFYSNTLIKSEL